MVAVIGGFFAEPARACRLNPPPVTLTNTLLAEADKSPIVARVRVLSVERRLQVTLSGGEALLPYAARALVFEAVKGVEAGSILAIDASPTVCGGGLYESQTRREGFIAGQFADDMVVLNRCHMYPRPL